VSVANHRRVFRPVRGGIQIFQPNNGEAGTLGMVLTSDDVDRWALTCLHVLARPDATLVPTDPVLQPDASGGAIAILRDAWWMANWMLSRCRAPLPDPEKCWGLVMLPLLAIRKRGCGCEVGMEDRGGRRQYPPRDGG
jgi:hypothetical protein